MNKFVLSLSIIITLLSGITLAAAESLEVTVPAKSEATATATVAADSVIKAETAVKVIEPTAKVDTVGKAESEIPVRLESSKKASESDSPLFRMLAGLAIVGLLAAGSLVYVKKIKKGKFSSEPAPDIKVLTQHYLGPKKSLAIIRVAGESILIGVTDQNISLIKELSLLDEDIPEHVPSKFKLKADRDLNNNSASEFDNEYGRDEFSFSGIKDVVTTKLKNMRTLQ
jgi:flagellar protein FliO/FliZ